MSGTEGITSWMEHWDTEDNKENKRLNKRNGVGVKAKTVTKARKSSGTHKCGVWTVGRVEEDK